MTEDHKKDLDREEDGDDYDMGGGSDVAKPSDPDHPTLDEMLEKDRGAASPTPTPEPRYLSYEKDGSKKSGTPASSDPAIKPKSKSKPRSKGDPKSPKDAGLEEEDQEDVVIMLHLGILELEALGILDPAMIPTVMTRATAVVFAPYNACIPGRQQTRQYDIADVDPWVIQKINTLTIMTMTLEVFSRALPFPPDHLIPGQNVRDLMAALPWNVLTGANIPEPMSFEITVDGRLGFLIERYWAVEFQDRIAYWESMHRFPVPTSLIRSDPYLATFVVERKNRRSHAGARWKQILFLIAMREGWCDLDLLLDPYFLHFPKRTHEVGWYPGIEARSANIADPKLNRREPADLIEALAECDAADQWRTDHAGHPARRITRLVGKFSNMAALNPNAPPLAPQP
ncbi:hypothetical protein PHMEG_00029624 [Phytophthora megakarya]|uniref:Uncharacterized protein n=1 Tax=Phytophthora megakarya TaxID=4795 RepID=A0A225V0N0_9STRA|nr:hypothetical protein PHMEG_00029624 [Phytophthora megakarya]